MTVNGKTLIIDLTLETGGVKRCGLSIEVRSYCDGSFDDWRENAESEAVRSIRELLSMHGNRPKEVQDDDR